MRVGVLASYDSLPTDLTDVTLAQPNVLLHSGGAKCLVAILGSHLAQQPSYLYKKQSWGNRRQGAGGTARRKSTLLPIDKQLRKLRILQGAPRQGMKHYVTIFKKDRIGG